MEGDGKPISEQFNDFFDATVAAGHKCELIQAFAEYFRVTVLPSLDADDVFIERVLQHLTGDQAAVPNKSPFLTSKDPFQLPFHNCLPLLPSILHAHHLDAPDNPFIASLYSTVTSFPIGWWKDPIRQSLGMRLTAVAAPPMSPRKASGIESDRLIVSGLRQHGPAWAAGVATGDLLLRVDGVMCRTLADVHIALARLKIGGRVRLTVWRQGAPTPVELVAVADCMPPLTTAEPPPAGDVSVQGIGSPSAARGVQRPTTPREGRGNGGMSGLRGKKLHTERERRDRTVLPPTISLEEDGEIWA